LNKKPHVLVEWLTGFGWYGRVVMRYRIPRIQVQREDWARDYWVRLWDVSGPSNEYGLTRTDALCIADQAIEKLGKALVNK
jgi:hypothetical protein